MSEQKAFSGWVYISKAEDLPGVWVAHFLDLNIVSQGDSPTQALEMVREAVGITLADDLSRGLDPNARRHECDEEWQPLLNLLEKHTKVPVAEMDAAAGGFKEFAVPLTIVMVKRDAAGMAPSVEINDLHLEALRAA